ncbi:replication initiator protein A [Deinococcus hopiensis]|uniref:Replication initiator protein A n=1 Tax=Deinococcus hopiensis KR-140 TaxID=695939 RepID=A0A1W1UW09_9DEIO|nr:replication initiator protein A [Deinococcus hopiensis]SMB85230.1 Replication initiator protein A [Deinococcus hopiensis KR-140]
MGIKRGDKLPPAPLEHVTRIDEANVSRLGLISIQERIPEAFTSWTEHFSVDGRPASLTCDAIPKYGGVPHGLDGDIATAIVDLFVESGSPENGIVHTSAYQILKRAGFPDAGRYYHNLRQTLFRLRTATYIASEAWRDHKRGHWTTVTFNYLSELEFTSHKDDSGLQRSSVIKIRLADSIVRSIRAKYTKPLDHEFATSLDRPLTRALYRLLDARRYPPDNPLTPMQSFTVNLVDWAAACKIVDQRTNKIRGTLKSAHDELIDRQYLEAVTYEGRGKTQRLTYRFTGHDPVSLTPVSVSPVVEDLMRHRISQSVARRLVDEFGEEHVQLRLGKFQGLLENGYKPRNHSGVLVDVIRDTEGKYPEPSTLAIKSRHTPMPTLAQSARAEPALSLEDRVDSALKTMQFLLRDRFTSSEYALLRMGLIIGQPEAGDVTSAAAVAKASGTLDAYADELRAALQIP